MQSAVIQANQYGVEGENESNDIEEDEHDVNPAGRSGADLNARQTRGTQAARFDPID